MLTEQALQALDLEMLACVFIRLETSCTSSQSHTSFSVHTAHAARPRITICAHASCSTYAISCRPAAVMAARRHPPAAWLRK